MTEFREFAAAMIELARILVVGTAMVALVPIAVIVAIAYLV